MAELKIDLQDSRSRNHSLCVKLEASEASLEHINRKAEIGRTRFGEIDSARKSVERVNSELKTTIEKLRT